MSRRRTRVAYWSADTTASTCRLAAIPHTDDSVACADTPVPRLQTAGRPMSNAKHAYRGLNAASGILSAEHSRPSGRAPSHRRTPAPAHRYPGKCANGRGSSRTSTHNVHRTCSNVHSVRTWAAADQLREWAVSARDCARAHLPRGHRSTSTHFARNSFDSRTHPSRH